MKGFIDNSGRALLDVKIRSNQDSPSTTIQIWIDTGFTGDLVLPQSTVDPLALIQSGTVEAILADGSHVELNTYTCIIEWFDGEWFDGQRRLEVISNTGEYPLLGVGLLMGLKLEIDYSKHELALEMP